jgi:hypothetical protein
MEALEMIKETRSSPMAVLDGEIVVGLRSNKRFLDDDSCINQTPICASNYTKPRTRQCGAMRNMHINIYEQSRESKRRGDVGKSRVEGWNVNG